MVPIFMPPEDEDESHLPQPHLIPGDDPSLLYGHRQPEPAGDRENIFIMFGAAGRGPVSELLELLLGAGSLGDLEDVEAHGLAQGPALAHRDDVANLDIPVEGNRAGLGEALLSAGPKGIFLSLGRASQLWLLQTKLLFPVSPAPR